MGQKTVIEATQCRLVSCSRLKTLLGLVDHASYHGKQNKEFQKFCYVIWQQTRGDVAGFEILPRTSELVDALELIPQQVPHAPRLLVHECVILARAAVLGLVQLLSLPVAR